MIKRLKESVTIHITIVNVICFLFFSILAFLGLINESSLTANYTDVNNLNLVSIITTFSHSNISHLIWNMFYLLLFGFAIEKSLGYFEFWIFFIFVGTLSGVGEISIQHYIFMNNVAVLGASGAIFGLAGIVYSLKSTLKIGKFKIHFGILIVTYLFYPMIVSLFSTGGNVAHIAHLTGFLLGAGYGKLKKQF